MNKLDLIIESIEYAKLVSVPAHRDELLDEALAAARELKSLKPVAWAVLRPDGRVKMLSHQKGVEVDLKWTPLYTKEKA